MLFRSQEGDLFIASVNEKTAFFFDAFWGTGDLLPSCIRDDTVGAKLIAAANDRDKGFDGVVPFSDEIVEILFKLVIGADCGTSGCEDLV